MPDEYDIMIRVARVGIPRLSVVEQIKEKSNIVPGSVAQAIACGDQSVCILAAHGANWTTPNVRKIIRISYGLT